MSINLKHSPYCFSPTYVWNYLIKSILNNINSFSCFHVIQYIIEEPGFISIRFYFVTAEVVAGSAAWLGRGLSCVCAQRQENDARPSFDLTPAQVLFLRYN